MANKKYKHSEERRKIGIIGKGYVGNALGNLLETNHDVVYYDKFKECDDYKVLNDCEAVFVCVPTPMKTSGEIDISAVEDAITHCPHVPIIIKSTVVPGTTDSLAKKHNREIYFSPEFLRQDYAVEDMKNPNRLVVTNKILLEIFKGLVDCPIIQTDNKTAELMKYSVNSMLASQVAIANEIYRICKTFGVKYDLVKESMLLDKRIGTNINVPGKDGFGFSGACFPKDLNAIIYHSKQKGYTPHLLEEVWRSND